MDEQQLLEKADEEAQFDSLKHNLIARNTYSSLKKNPSSVIAEEYTNKNEYSPAHHLNPALYSASTTIKKLLFPRFEIYETLFLDATVGFIVADDVLPRLTALSTGYSDQSRIKIFAMSGIITAAPSISGISTSREILLISRNHRYDCSTRLNTRGACCLRFLIQNCTFSNGRIRSPVQRK